LDYPDYAARIGSAFQVLTEDLARIGITLSIGSIPSDKYYGMIFNHKIPEAITVAGIADYPDPMNMLNLLYYSKYAKPNGFNLSNYANAVVDRDLLANLKSTDNAERLELATSIARTVSEDMPLNAMWWENTITAVNKKFKVESLTGFYFLQPWATTISLA
jgi:ABC-type transport system substrate-binding protein